MSNTLIRPDPPGCNLTCLMRWSDRSVNVEVLGKRKEWVAYWVSAYVYM